MSEIVSAVQDGYPAGPPAEAAPDREINRLVPRIVVFGQIAPFYGGAKQLVDAIKDYLVEHNIPAEGLVMSRDVKNIEDAFYGRRQSVPKHAQDEVPATARHTKKGPWFGPLFVPQVDQTTPSPEDEAFSAGLPDATIPVDTIPSLVFVLPKMREYDGGNNGSTINTPVEMIVALCEEHGVPMVIIGADTTVEDLESAVSGLPQLPALEKQ